MRWVYVRGGRKADTRSVRLTGVALDITGRKRAEAELRRLNETLETRIAERTAQLSESNARLIESRFPSVRRRRRPSSRPRRWRRSAT